MPDRAPRLFALWVGIGAFGFGVIVALTCVPLSGSSEARDAGVEPRSMMARHPGDPVWDSPGWNHYPEDDYAD